LKKLLNFLGYSLIIMGGLALIFSAILFFSGFGLMEHLPVTDQYLMAILLALLFIVLGLILHRCS